MLHLTPASQDLTADVQTLWNVLVCRIPAGYYPPTSHCLREIGRPAQPPAALTFGFGNAIGYEVASANPLAIALHARVAALFVRQHDAERTRFSE